MPMRDRLARLVQRNPERPSLRQRAAALKASAAKVMRRPAVTPAAPPTPAPAPVVEPGTDAEFLRLEREWDEARGREEAAYARQREIAPGGSGLGPAPQGMPEWREWHEKVREWRASSGIADAEEDGKHWCGVVDDIARQIAALPATSLTGMRVKARVLRHFEEIQVDPVSGLVGGLARDVLALAPEALPEDAGALALIDAIEREWGAWSAASARDYGAEDDEADARTDARNVARTALLDAAIAMPANSRAARHAKALAHAWIGFVDSWRHRRPREGYHYDGLLAFDIDAALAPDGMAADPECPLEAVGAAPSGRSIQKPGEEATAEPSGPASPDLSKLSIVQLRNLHERYVQVSDLWNDALHAPWTNHADGAGFRASNAAGDLIEAEQTRICDLYLAVVAELSSRTPSDGFETSWQLETLIRHELMCNGDLREAPDLRAAIAERWSA